MSAEDNLGLTFNSDHNAMTYCKYDCKIYNLRNIASALCYILRICYYLKTELIRNIRDNTDNIIIVFLHKN